MSKTYRVGIFKRSTTSIPDNEAQVANYFEGTWEQLPKVITEAAWTHICFGDKVLYSQNPDLKPYQKQEGYRVSDNFDGADFMALDIDDHKSMEEVHTLLKDYRHIIAPTKSHQQFKNGVKRDRYRVLVDLERPVNTPAEYRATWRALNAILGYSVDTQARDLARFWQPSVGVQYKSEGRCFSVAQPTADDINTGRDYLKTEWVEGLNSVLESHLRNNHASRIVSETPEKITLRCLLHKDTQHSAFINKSSNWYNCDSPRCPTRPEGWSCNRVAEHLGLLKPNNNELLEQQSQSATLKQSEERLKIRNWLLANLYDAERIDALVPQPVDWLCEGFINAKGVTVLTADSGLGKTWLLMDLMLSCTHETDWLTNFPVKKCNVLYMPYEEDADDMKLRTELLKVGRLTTLERESGAKLKRLSNYNEYWVPVPPHSFQSSEFAEEVLALAKSLDVQLLIIDTLRQAAGGADENSAGEMGVVLHHLRNIADSIGGAVIVSHHVGKSGSEYRGSSVIKDNTQGLLHYHATSEDGVPCHRLKVVKVKQGHSHNPLNLWRISPPDLVSWSFDMSEEQRVNELLNRVELIKRHFGTESFSSAQLARSVKSVDLDELLDMSVILPDGCNAKGNELYKLNTRIEDRLITAVSAQDTTPIDNMLDNLTPEQRAVFEESEYVRNAVRDSE